MYIHTQNIAASTWYINHSMTRNVILDVNIYIDGRLTKVKPNNIIHIDDNTCAVEFSTARAGVATVLGPFSGTNGSTPPPPPPVIPPLLRGFNTNDLTGSITLDPTNTIVNGFSGATRSVVSRNVGKYQFRVYYQGTNPISAFPQDIDIGITTTAFALAGDPYSRLNGDKITFSAAGVGNYGVTGEFADSTLPGRFIPRVSYNGVYGSDDILDVLVNLDEEEVTFRVSNGVDQMVHTESIPAGKSWNVYVGSAGGQITDLAFDFVGDTFTPDINYKVWDSDDGLESTPQPFKQSLVMYGGVNTIGSWLTRVNDSRPVALVRGNGGVKSLIARGGSGKYQYRVFCEREFLTNPMLHNVFIGVGSINSTDTSNPLGSLEGDSVVLGFDPTQPLSTRGMGYSFANHTLPNRGEVIQMNGGTGFLRNTIFDFLLDLDNNQCTIRVREDSDETFQVDGPVIESITVPIPSGVAWHAYASIANSTSMTFDTAGYRFVPDPGYLAWDTPDGNVPPAFVPLTTLTPIVGFDPSVSTAPNSTNGKRAVVSGNGHVRSQVSHRGSGKFQYRIYNERGLSSPQLHFIYHGLGSVNSSTSASNSYSVAQGDTISFGRPSVSETYKVMHQFADSYGQGVVQYPQMPVTFSYDHILDVLLDLDANQVTFRVREIGNTSFVVDGPVIYTLTVPIPPNVEWYVFSFFPNATTSMVYDLAGYRFVPDPGYEPWDFIPPTPTATLRGFDVTDTSPFIQLLDNGTKVGYISNQGGSINSSEIINGYTRSVVGRSGSGKYQFRFYHDSTSSVFVNNINYGIASKSTQHTNGGSFYSMFEGDKVMLCSIAGNLGVNADFSDSDFGGRFEQNINPGPTIPFNTLTNDDWIDILLDLDNNQVRFLINDGALLDRTVSIPPNVTWYIMASQVYRFMVGDFIGSTFTPQPGYLPWDADGNEGIATPTLTSLVPKVSHTLLNNTSLFSGDNRPITHVRNITSSVSNTVRTSTIRTSGGKYQFRVYLERGGSTAGTGVPIGTELANVTTIGFCSSNYNEISGFNAGSRNEEGNLVAISKFSFPAWGIIEQYADLTYPDRGNDTFSSSFYIRLDDLTIPITSEHVVDALIDLDNNQVRFIIRQWLDDTYGFEQLPLFDRTYDIEPGLKWMGYVCTAKFLPLVVDTAGYKFTPQPGYQPWDVVDANITTPSPTLDTMVPLVGFNNPFSSNGKRQYLLISGTYWSQLIKSGSGKYQYRVYCLTSASRNNVFSPSALFGIAEASTTTPGDQASTLKPAIVVKANGSNTQYTVNDGVGNATDYFENASMTKNQVIDVLLNLDANQVTFRMKDIDWEGRIADGPVVQQRTFSIPTGVDWRAHVIYRSNTGDIYYDTAGYRFTPDPGYLPWDDPS